MLRLRMHFFGPGQVLLASNEEARIRSRKEFGLLAYLAMENGRAHQRESILGLFWPELTQTRARNNLRVALARLRKGVDQQKPPLILSEKQTLRFFMEPEQGQPAAWLDVAEFNRLLTSVNAHRHDNPIQCPTCLADMAAAAALYQGEFLHGFHIDGCEEFEHWLLGQRERLHLQIMALLPRLEEAYIASANWQEAEKCARQRLSLDALNEDAHRTLMHILALSGLRNSALSQYDICCRVLLDELGITPDPKTVELAEQIRAGDYRLDQVDETPAPNVTEIVHRQSKVVDPYAILNRLDPLPDQKLFGAEAALETVGAALDNQTRSWLLALEGIGGLGKTTLANALVMQRIERENEALVFQDIAWVSAKQEEYLADRGIHSTGKAALDEESLMDQLLAQLADGPYPTGNTQEKRLALTQLLKEKVCLVVVDNLETAVDYGALLPLLRHLANPSKFLITSRVSLAGQGDIFCYSLAELNEEDALAFLRHEADSRGMILLAAADDDQLRTAYETVGGNPLALKLVLGQLQFLPLAEVLEHLRLADSKRSDELYTYIYWQAWQLLDAPSRHLLLCLPIVPNATFAQLANISNLATDLLQAALMNLRSLSLVEVGGDLNQPRYRLHRLTETFLMHEVVRWQEAGWHGGKVVEWQVADDARYFVERIRYMVERWNADEAVHNVDATILDHEYESVVKAVSLGLELAEGWSLVKPLIISFTPFMERRGHWHTWHSILDRAIDSAQRAADLDGEITITALVARLCQRESRPDDVVYYYRRAILLARRRGNRFEEARSCSNLGYAFIDDGHWWRSEVLCSHALRVFEELGSDHGRAHTHNHLGLLYTREKRWEQAEENLKRACGIWQTIPDEHGLVSGFANLGILYIQMDKSALALRTFEDACAVAEKTGELSIIANVWNNMAIAHRMDSNWSEANKYAQKAESHYRQTADLSKLAHVWHNLGLVAEGSGRHEEAAAYLEESLKVHKSLNNRVGVSEVQSDLTRATAQR